jgi:predicted nuclease of predicted toxin-antitoxin system
VRLLADENFPTAGVAALRAAGHDVAAVAEAHPGVSDEVVLAWAREEDRVLVTFDRDFGELLFRRGAAPPPGLVYLRFVPKTPEEPGILLATLAARAQIVLEGQLTVMDARTIRQRPLPGAG